jgi:hypothetical protein
MVTVQAPTVRVIKPFSPAKLVFGKLPYSALASLSLEFTSRAGIPYILTQVIDRPGSVPAQYDQPTPDPYAYLILTQAEKNPVDFSEVASEIEILTGGHRETINHTSIELEEVSGSHSPLSPQRWRASSYSRAALFFPKMRI